MKKILYVLLRLTAAQYSHEVVFNDIIIKTANLRRLKKECRY